MKYYRGLLFVLLTAFSLSGCAEPKKYTPTVLTVPEPQKIEIYYVEASLIEGKTQKSYVLEALGIPDSFETGDDYSHATYTFYDKPINLKAKIHIVQKDGTDLNIIVGKGEKHTRFIIDYTQKGTIRNISIY